MKNIREFQSWRAEQITKVFLLSSGLFNLREFHYQHDEVFDFVAILKENPNKSFGIDVKATKYSRSEIQEKYFSNIHIKKLPLIQFFVNYDKESGYFRIVYQDGNSDLKPMERSIFTCEMKKIFQ